MEAMNSVEIDKNCIEKAKEANSDISEDLEVVLEEETETEESKTILVVDKYEIKLIPKNYIVVGRKNPKYDPKEEGSKYWFSWDKVPGNHSGRLIQFLKEEFGISWVTTAKIEKIDDSRNIRVFAEKNYLSLGLNNEKNKVNLKIDDGRSAEFKAKSKEGKLNIYGSKKFSKDYRTYHSNLHSALIELSNRILEDKLKEVSKEKPLELKELANLIKEHHKYLEGFARAILSRGNLPDR
ncbi:hypothetical protein KKF82_07595 [Patescibacteria group bacterium]|nr:hypothetical protein [Patescibacteria group bacterium]